MSELQNKKEVGTSFRTLDDFNPKGQKVLVRVDLNVPMKQGRISDKTRIERVIPTIKELADKGARVILISHFDRPEGKFVPSMSLAPLVDALSQILEREVKFCPDSIGNYVKESIATLADGDIILLENLRFNAGEEANDTIFSKELASLADIYVNDAFSCSHRAHASITGVCAYLPAYAGRLMQEELEALSKVLEHPERPVAAIVGGSKVSTKLQLLENLIAKVDMLIIGGAMANTFLFAKGYKIGKSLHEPQLKDTALKILEKAKQKGCEIILPVDATIAYEFRAGAPSMVVDLDEVPDNAMILDAGIKTTAMLAEKLGSVKTIVWNGPVGAFETPPFDNSSVFIAKIISYLTRKGKVMSIAGGGDTVSALSYAGAAENLSYVSTAGGAFLEWLEGKPLAGVEVLMG